FVIFFIGCFVTGKFENLQPYFIPGGTGNAAAGILAAIASMLFFMNGFDTIPKAADEAASGINMKNLAKALIGTIVLGSVVYLFVILSTSLIMVPGESVNLGSLPLISAYELSTGSKFLVYIMIFGTIMGVTTTFNGFLLAGSKLLSQFATAGFVSRAVGKQNAKGIPTRALIILALIATAGLFAGKGLLTPLITMGGIAFLVAWFFVAVSTLRFSSKEPNTPRLFKTPGGKPMMWIAVIITAALTLAMVLPGTFISLGITENTLLAAWVILGIVVYVVYRKQDIVIERLPVPAVQNEKPADAEPPQGSNVGSLPAIQAQ
ncbi:MAG: APC family permease, partial [Eggerthellaceae bacterium]